MGMIAAARLAHTIDMFSKQGVMRIENLIKRIGLFRSLQTYGITTRRVMYCMQFDKKNRNKKISLVLPTRIGHVTVCNTVSYPRIEQTVNNLFF